VNSLAYAFSGITYTYPLITKDPANLKGSRFSFWHQPEFLIFNRARIFFDASLGNWWVNDHAKNNQILIFSLAPVLRYTILDSDYFSPFFDLSIGLSSLSSTRIDHQNLGIYFAFQDQLGLGTTIGKSKRLSISLSALHYSNASLCASNAGITIPLLLNMVYRF
jgi:hypothetical protein